MKRVKVVLMTAMLAMGVLAINACGRSVSSGQKAANVANNNIDQMNQIANILSQKGVRVSLDSTSTSTHSIPATLSAKDLLAVHVYLTEYIQLGQAVLATAGRPDVKLKDSKIVSNVQNGITDATAWLGNVDKRESDLRSAATKK